MAKVRRLLEHPPVEFQPGQLSVKKALGRVRERRDTPFRRSRLDAHIPVFFHLLDARRHDQPPARIWSNFRLKPSKITSQTPSIATLLQPGREQADIFG